MLIAVLLALGVTAGGILLLLLALTLIKRFKTIKNPAVFKLRVRLVEGPVAGLSDGWKRGYGAWVADVLTVRRGPALHIAAVLPVATVERIGPVPAEEVKGLGESPTVAALTLRTGARLELAVPAAQRKGGLRPWEPWEPAGAPPAPVAGAAPAPAAVR